MQRVEKEEWSQPSNKKDAKCGRLNKEGRAKGGDFPENSSQIRREKEAKFPWGT